MRKFNIDIRGMIVVVLGAIIFFYLRIMIKLGRLNQSFSYGAKRRDDVFE